MFVAMRTMPVTAKAVAPASAYNNSRAENAMAALPLSDMPNMIATGFETSA